MNYPPRALTETWLFLTHTIDPECEEAKQKAMNNIIKVFGNIDIAEIYLGTFDSDKYPKSA